MLNKDEYKILKKLIRYKNKVQQNDNIFILDDDFYQILTTKQKKYINALLQKLDESGLISDLYFIHNVEPHMISITDLGIYEYERYHKNKINIYKHDFIIALITVLLTLLIPKILSLLA